MYGGLAVVFLADFIGFGVGSDVSGGLSRWQARNDKLVEQAMSRAIANASPSQRRALRSQLPALRQRSVTVPGLLGEATLSGPGA